MDEYEQKCIDALTLSLRKAGARDSGDDETRNDSKKDDEMICSPTSTTTTLPDAVIQHNILSYRPFRPLRVVLIRGKTENAHLQHNLWVRNEYSLTFSTNRGPLRFRVVELPYLPPSRFAARRNRLRYSEDEQESFFRDADGVIISCYIARFFEFCDRYGYHYASTSILEDVSSRVQQRNDGDEQRMPYHGEHTTCKNQSPKTVVLCGNGVDITHVDARLSSVVFRDGGNPSDDDELVVAPASSFIDEPRHPFASLARSVTNDDGLEFADVVEDSSRGRPMDTKVSMDESLSNMAVQMNRIGSSAAAYPPTEKRETKTPNNMEEQNQMSWDWLRAQVSS